MADVLSRIAESLFWIGRYVERAEDTARILDVQTQLLVEDPAVDEESACRTLLSIMGVEPPEGRRVDAALVLELALLRPDLAGTSIAGRRSVRPGERPAGPRDAVGRHVGGHQHHVPLPCRRDSSGRCAPATPSAGCASGPR